MHKRIDELTQKILAGGEILPAEARELADVANADLPHLFAAANSIRQQFQGEQVHLCAILNGRSGHCSEDCSY